MAKPRKAAHDDAAQDKALIVAAVKPAALKGAGKKKAEGKKKVKAKAKDKKKY